MRLRTGTLNEAEIAHSRAVSSAGGAVLVAAVLLFAAIGGVSQAAGIDGRDRDPVVLTGSSVPGLEGIDPGSLIAFRREAGDWKQIPVQVDERHGINLRALYPTSPPGGGAAVVVEAYADAATLSGPDADATLDADDEIALMAADAGPRVRASYGRIPDGAKAAGATEVRVRETGGQSSFFYLFEAAGPVDQGAGMDYVDYEFNLLAGDYLPNYGFASGPNPEASTVETDFYSTGLSDRWINDELRLKAGDASGADILDREKAQFLPGVCGRSTTTFSSGEGSFVTNRDGPVRAIRSFIGANSGPYTQREHVFYRRHSETRTFLRVHSIPGVMQFTDYSPEAAGMTYRNASNPEGVTIDGQPDSPDPALPAGILDGTPYWEQVSGPQGSMDVVTRVETDITGLSARGYYLDDATPDQPVEVQCTGDPTAYGSSGTWIDTGIANTDPRLGDYGILTAIKTAFYEAPAASAARAATRAAQIASPLVHTASPLAPPSGPAKIRATLNRSRVVLGPRRGVTIRVRVRNAGESRSGRVKVCARVRGRGARIAGGRRCRRRDGLGPGRGASLKFGIRAQRRKARGPVRVSFTVFSAGRRVGRLAARARIR